MVQVPAPSACEAHCTLLVMVCASVSSDRPRPCARGGGVGSDACGVVDWTPIRRRILSFWGTLQGTASPIPLSLFLGVGAPSLSLAGFMFAVARRGSLFVVASAACVYETGLLLVSACRTSAASVEPLPRGWRAVAIPRWLSVLNL